MKCLGLGIDLIYTPRIRRLLETYKERFLKKFFHQEEIDYALKKTKVWEALAASFAVKEAFYKAIGGYSPFSFKEISLHRDPSTGKPYLKLYGKAEEIFQRRGGKKIDLSLSHDFQYTIVVVILWGEE
ncbi:MAG: holo-ACP synthase [Caldimicrobium sp.]